MSLIILFKTTDNKNWCNFYLIRISACNTYTMPFLINVNNNTLIIRWPSLPLTAVIQPSLPRAQIFSTKSWKCFALVCHFYHFSFIILQMWQRYQGEGGGEWDGKDNEITKEFANNIIQQNQVVYQWMTSLNKQRTSEMDRKRGCMPHFNLITAYSG